MRYFFFILSILPFAGYAQLLDNSKGNAFSEIPFFNETFIRNNHLKTIKGTFTYKKMGDIMRETNLVSSYEFDRNGHLTIFYETQKKFDKKDTLILFYGYDSRGNLEFVRRRDQKGFYSTHYEYDSLNRKIKEEFRRDIDTAGTILIPTFERSTVLNFETMTYEKNSNQLKMTLHNSYGFPYLDEFSNFNADGYLLNKESRLKMTSQTVTTLYGYTEKGWISKITTTSSAYPKNGTEIMFKYDNFGNLTDKQIYKNGVFTTDIQIIYNAKTGLLSSILTREVETNFISILRFDTYDYF